MNIITSDNLNNIGSFAFVEMDKVVADLRLRGITPIDFGVGDPTEPTPEFIRLSAKEAIDSHAASGYPSYSGSQNYLKAIANWMKERFGVELNPETEISSTLGAKEAIFNFPKSLINPGDVVIVPSPGYPPYKNGTILSGGVPYFVPLLEENKYLLDYNSIPADVAQKAKIIWINYPNSPTGACADRQYYEGLIGWAQEYEIVIAADEGCYIDIYYENPPMSILEIAKEGIITFYSLSKRNNMTGYRVGWVAGDERLIEMFKKLKVNIDSGTPNFVQVAAEVALADRVETANIRDVYKQKKKILLDCFSSLGWPRCDSEATFYLWQKVPVGFTSLEFAKFLLRDDIAIVVTPGEWIGDVCEGDINPGAGYVRMALVPPLSQVKEAAQRLKKALI